MLQKKSAMVFLIAVLAVFSLTLTAEAAKGGGGCKDRDGDGYFQKDGCGTAVDCDDADASVNPGAAEVCDSIDNNCDGIIDEGCGGCTDNDGDGYGIGPDCLGPDCDDNDAAVNPGAAEVCDDNLDNNCDGTVDEDCGGCVPTVAKEKGCDCFDNTDNDCDGSTDSLDRDCKKQICDTCFDDDADSWYTCGGDCDDTDPTINPGASEACNGIDDNCDGSLPPEEQDADGDGVSICEGDCDDFNPNKSPNNTEEPFGSPVCNDGIDNDCDNLIDASDPGCENPCIDNDGDGYGANGNPYCPNFGIDCNDIDPAIHPEAMEVPYDGIDQDCNGSDLTDVDRDGYDAEVAGGIDCNDINSLIYPGAIEGPYGDLTCCDTVDNNCDGQADSFDSGCQDGTGQAAKCAYKIIDLGTLGGDSSYARSINNNDQITGYSMTVNGDIRAFLYEDGIMTDLGTLEGRRTEAYDINNSGQVVGYSEVAKGPFVYGPRAFLFENGTMTDIGTLHAFGINDSGQIVGSDSSHGYIFESGAASDLGTLGGDYSTAYDINNSSQIVGYSNLVNGGDFHAFLYENGVMTDLGTLGGTDSWAHSINDLGQIVGYSHDPNGNTHAFLYENGVMTDLGTLGSHLSSAFDINNNGQIVGQSPNGSYTHAFVYESGIMTDLGTLGGRHSRAEGINDNGLITGYAYIGDSERHAVIWTPDADNDGYYSDEDCDDTNPNINPGVSEGPVGDPTCADTVDNDCDGFTDAGDSGCTDGADVPHDTITDCTLCHDQGTYVAGAPLDNNKCLACHDGVTATLVETHHTPADLNCTDCHNVMRSQLPNIKHIKTTLASFTANAAGTDFANGTGIGICETCHVSTAYYNNTGTGAPHETGVCTDCHTHRDGFIYTIVPPGPHNIYPDCTVCHDPGTYVLNAPIPDGKCLACHDGVTATLAASHYSGRYIDPATGELVDIVCVECHNVMRPQTNAASIRSVIRGRPTVYPPLVTGPPSYNGICEVCHTQSYYYRNDGTGVSHETAVCTACHTHQQGFVTTGPEIDIPHNFITDCTVCHDPGTYVVNADIPNVKCLACHDGSTATQVDTHYSNTYIDPSTGLLVDILCVECHNPMRAQINLKHVREPIRGAVVVFTALTGPNSFADGDMVYDGICEVCHTQTLYHRSDGSTAAHEDGNDCTLCHVH